MNFRSLLIIVIALGAASCQNSLLYDEARDNQGKAAVKAVEEAHLTATVESLGKAFTDMALKEEANARNKAQQLFNWQVESVARANSLDAGSKVDPVAAGTSEEESGQDDDKPGEEKGLFTVGNSRLKKLGLIDAAPSGLDGLIAKDGERRDTLEAFHLKRITFRGAYDVAFASCSDVRAASSPAEAAELTTAAATEGTPIAHEAQLSEKVLKRIRENSRPFANADYQQMASDCKSLDAQSEALISSFDRGSVRGKARAIDRVVAARKTYDEQKAEVSKNIEDAKNSLKSLEGTKPGKSKLDAVETEADALLKKIETARQVNELAGTEVLAKEKLDRLEAILARLAGSTEESELKLSKDELLGIGLVRALPGLRDEAKAMLTGAAKPRLTPLIAAIDYQKLLLAKIEAVQQIEQKRLSLSEAQLNAELDEALAWAQVLKRIHEGRWAGQSIGDLNAKLKGAEKGKLYEALAIYGDGVREARVSQAVLNSRQLAIEYELNLINSRFAAAQWDSLMDMTSKILSEYHAAGIKKEEIAEFLKALGLVTIGVGAAQ
jgi:hypothetical protein